MALIILYSNMNNLIINNNNEKNKILIVRIAARYCQRRFKNVSLTMTFFIIFQLALYKKKRTTLVGSGADGKPSNAKNLVLYYVIGE
jgi:hypothetical protein